jgi:hypothetical protein
MNNSIIQKLAERWPSPVVARTEMERFTGGAVKGRHLANLDSQGKGPEGRLRVGRKIVYSVESVVDFLERRTEAVKPKKRAEDK